MLVGFMEGSVSVTGEANPAPVSHFVSGALPHCSRSIRARANVASHRDLRLSRAEANAPLLFGAAPGRGIKRLRANAQDHAHRRFFMRTTE